MKRYLLHFAVSLTADGESYSPKFDIKVDVKENLPANTDAQKYIRTRLAEEVKRHFDALVEPIDNLTDEAKEGADALA